MMSGGERRLVVSGAIPQSIAHVVRNMTDIDLSRVVAQRRERRVPRMPSLSFGGDSEVRAHAAQRTRLHATGKPYMPALTFTD